MNLIFVSEKPISGRTTACPVALAGVVTHVHVSCIGMRQKKDGKGWWEWRVLCKSKNEFQFLTSKKIARRKSKAELKQHNDVSNSFRSDTKMISKLKSHYLAISPSIVLDLDSWVVERNDETTSSQNGSKVDTAFQMLFVGLPSPTLSHWLLPVPFSLLQLPFPTIAWRESAKEWNKSSESSSNQWSNWSSFFKLTGGREEATGCISITTNRPHSSKVRTGGEASLNFIATSTSIVGSIWIVFTTSREYVIDNACISAIALGVTNLTRVGRD